MAFTPEQRRKVGEFVQAARARGASDIEIEAEVKRRFDPISRLTSKFEGTLAIPTASVAPTPDVPLIGGTARVTGAALKDAVVGPFAGLLERGGLVEEGTRQGIRKNFEDTRLDFLASDPGPLRTIISGVGETAANVVPITPGGPIGKAAAKGLNLTGRAARVAAGAGAGLAEGAVVAAGDAPLVPEGSRAKVGLVQTLGAGALGALGGARATSHIVSDEGTKAFQRKFFRNQKRQGPEKTVGTRVAGLYNDWVNSLQPIERTLKKAGLDKEGQIAAQRVRVAQSISRGPVYHRTRDLAGNDTGEALMPILDSGREAADSLGIGRDEFFQDAQHYLVSQRQGELAGRGNVKTKTASTLDADRRLNELEVKYGTDESGNVKFLHDFGDRFRDWSVRAHLDPLREVGVITQDEYAKILSQNEFFVPFQRAMDELDQKGIDLTLGDGPPIKGKRITEGLSSDAGKRLDDVFGVSADRAIRVHVFAEQQRLRNLLGQASELDPTIGAEIKPKLELLRVKLDPTEARRLGKDEIFRQRQAKGDKVFDVWQDGKRKSFTAPDDVMKALSTLNPKEFNAFTKWYQKVARPFAATFRAGSTLALEFGVRNVLRDPWTLGIYSRNGAIPFISSTKAFAEAFFDIQGGRELWQEFIESPAAHATFLSPDRWDLARELRAAQDVASKGKVSRAVSGTIRNPLLPLQKVSDGLEKFSRFGEFSKARKRGKSVNEAGLDAADVTLNFPRAGNVGKVVNAGEAFFNASVQDLDKFARSMGERPFATMLKGAAYLTAPTLSAYARYKDDPDYQNLPEWQKVLTLPVYKLDNGRFISIPKPPGVLNLMFSYLPQKSLEFLEAKGADASGRDLKRIIDETLQGISDQTPLTYTPIGDAESGDFVLDLLPNAIQPLAELKANRIPFFDRPVTSRSLENLPPELRSNEFTTSPAQAIGSGPLADALGGPQGVDHLIRGYLGTLGRVGAEAASPGRDEALLRRNLPEWARDIPVLRNAVRALTSSSPVGFGSKPVARFYDLAQAVAEAKAGANTFATGSKEEQLWLNSHPEGNYASDIRFYKEEISDISAERKAVVSSKKLSNLEKDDHLLQLDSQVTLLAAEAVDVIEGLIEQDLRRTIEQEMIGEENP